MATLTRKTPTAPPPSPTWPQAVGYPTADQINDPDCPFHIPASLRDDYWATASDAGWCRDRMNDPGENQDVAILRFAREHAGFRPFERTERIGSTHVRVSARNQTTETVAAAARRFTTTMQASYGVNRDGIYAHALARDIAARRHATRENARQSRAHREARATCDCCGNVDPTTRTHEPHETAPTSLVTPLSRARSKRLCEACWVTAAIVTADKAGNRATVAAYLDTL